MQGISIVNRKYVNRKFFFTPLARICNPCYNKMARIATKGQRPKGDKSALAKTIELQLSRHTKQKKILNYIAVIEDS